MAKRRIYRVRWWSMHWNEWAGVSYAYEERALATAQAMWDAGSPKVIVWNADTNQTLFTRRG